MPCVPVSSRQRASGGSLAVVAIASRIAWSSALRLRGLEIVRRTTPSAGSSMSSSPGMAGEHRTGSVPCATFRVPRNKMETADLNHLDELYLHLDRPDEPWGVHFEVVTRDALDDDRLREAIRTAASRHPIARARLADWRPTDTNYHWEIGDDLDEVPLSVSTDATAAREALYGASPSLG